MKAIKGSLAIICLLAFAVVAVSALVERRPESPAKAFRVVYVDCDRLMRSHPGWQQVLGVRAAITDLSRTNQRVDLAGVKSRPPAKPALTWDYAETGAVKREELVKALKENALSAVGRVEDFERAKLERNVSRKESELETEMRARLAERTRDVESELAAECRSIDQERSAGRLAAQMKIVAVRSRLGSMNSIEEEKANQELADAEKALAKYDEETKARIEKVCRPLQDELAHFKTRSRLQLEADEARFRAEQESRLSAAVTSQRDETLAELSKDALSSVSAGSSRATSVARADGSDPHAVVVDEPAVSGAGSRREAIRRLQETERRLVARIRRDVTRQAETAAREHGLVLKFGSPPSGEPDFTYAMVGLIARTEAPSSVVAGAGGSG